MEEERPDEETELPATPSAGAVGTMSVPLVDIEEVDESPSRTGTSSGQTMYQPQWANIHEDSMLNSPLLRVDWVVQALPSAKLRPYICDIANRAAILVKDIYVNDRR